MDTPLDPNLARSAAEPLTGPADPLAGYPPAPAARPAGVIRGGSYRARFARAAADVRTVQRLRFEVFNLELGEGLEESFASGLDHDRFDAWCHHLLVEHRPSRRVVGTYRLQTYEMARAGEGFYTAGEFDFSRLPEEMLVRGVETGRACVDAAHRNGRVLNLLWKGLASYLMHNRRDLLFGCCSLTSQDPNVARQTYEFLVQSGYLHPEYRTVPMPAFEPYPPDFVPDVDVTVKLPALFASYLKLRSKVTGPPALDREFKTIDFLTVLDLRELDDAVRHTFFRHSMEPEESGDPGAAGS